MDAKALACALALCAAGAAWAGPERAAAEPRACTLPQQSEMEPFFDRSGTLSRYEQLSPDCLKHVVVQCAAAADHVMLDLGSAALCSIGYEALLSRGFGGNFQALVAWWRSVREDPVP